MVVTRRLTAHEKRFVAARGGWTCSVCHGMLDATYEVDHIVPLHKGGEDHVDNCQALHRTCHAEKTQREEIERLHNLQMTACSERRRPPLECTRCKNIVAPYFLHDCRKIT
tara:strand:+ start:254 stop:586 length:333 start_codon:yes stop_codon:yes gene_type:complete